jgi:hypothetical protein
MRLNAKSVLALFYFRRKGAAHGKEQKARFQSEGHLARDQKGTPD